MKHRESSKKHSIAKLIVGELFDTAGYLFETGMRSYKPIWSRIPVEIYHSDTYTEISRRRLRQLERQKWVQTRKQGEEIYFRLTNEGFAQGLKLLIATKHTLLPKAQLCLIVFDIPEAMRPVRDELRSILKEVGCVMTQKSVWQTRKDLVRELRLFARSVKAEKYIKVYTVLP